MAHNLKHSTGIDMDRFRLRRFMEHLVEIGEVDLVDTPIDMVDIAARMDGNLKAAWFTRAGPEECELVGNVSFQIPIDFLRCHGFK